MFADVSQPDINHLPLVDDCSCFLTSSRICNNQADSVLFYFIGIITSKQCVLGSAYNTRDDNVIETSDTLEKPLRELSLIEMKTNE